MDEHYRHMRVLPFEQDTEVAFPTKMEPTFSLSFFRKCEDGAVILNANGRVGFMNEAAREVLGLNSIADAVLLHWSELWPDAASSKMAEAVTRALEGDAVRLAGLPSAIGPVDMLFAPVINQETVVESIFAVMFPSGQSPRISG